MTITNSMKEKPFHSANQTRPPFMDVPFLCAPDIKKPDHLCPLATRLSASGGPVAFRLPITRDLALSWKITKKAPFRRGGVLPGALI